MQALMHLIHTETSWYSNMVYADLMQRHTRMRVTGHHLPSVWTWSSMSFNGLELRLELELKRKPQVSS